MKRPRTHGPGEDDDPAGNCVDDDGDDLDERVDQLSVELVTISAKMGEMMQAMWFALQSKDSEAHRALTVEWQLSRRRQVETKRELQDAHAKRAAARQARAQTQKVYKEFVAGVAAGGDEEGGGEVGSEDDDSPYEPGSGDSDGGGSESDARESELEAESGCESSDSESDA